MELNEKKNRNLVIEKAKKESPSLSDETNLVSRG